MKYKIEKNTVQETLIIPLFARKVCSELYPNLYRDETSIRKAFSKTTEFFSQISLSPFRLFPRQCLLFDNVIFTVLSHILIPF